MMIFTMSKKDKFCRKVPFSFGGACLLAVFLTALAGCAAPELFRIHPELAEQSRGIQAVGLLQPSIALYEEQFRFGLNKTVAHEEWSQCAAETLTKAFIDEAAFLRMPLTVIDTEDREAGDLLDLFSAVDLSIQRHSYKTRLKEIFPERIKHFDYSLGQATNLMERYHIDGIWIVTGFNLIPTAGAKAGDAAQYFLATLSALGGGPGVVSVLKKLEFRAALVDKGGHILFYTKLDESNIRSAARVPARPAPLNPLYSGADADQMSEESAIGNDLRVAKTAGHYIRALLAEYRKVVAR